MLLNTQAPGPVGQAASKHFYILGAGADWAVELEARPRAVTRHSHTAVYEKQATALVVRDYIQ